MAKVKKAQLGDHLVKRKSQDDRIHRIEKKDPERAERVADRVQKRVLRSEKPSPVKPTGKMFIPLRERAKAANERKAAAKAPKAQNGKKVDSLTYSTTGRYAPKQRVAIDTTGYAGGKKEFTATSELSKKPRKVGRKLVDRTIGAMKAGKIKKAQNGDTTQVQKPPVLKPKGRTDMAGTDLFDRFSRDRNRISSMSRKGAAARRMDQMMMKRVEKPRISSANKPGGMRLGGGIKKAQFGSTEGGRCGISRAAAKDARKSERDYAKQSRQAEREQKRESKAAARQAKRTPSMGKGGNISKKKK